MLCCLNVAMANMTLYIIDLYTWDRCFISFALFVFNKMIKEVDLNLLAKLVFLDVK